MAVQRERRAAGDFRLGARAFLDLEQVQQNGERIAGVPRRGARP
jgi:hypothetical protein